MFWMCIRIASVRRFIYTPTAYDFMEKYRNFSLFIILIPTPNFPHFNYMLGGNLGSLLYGDVSVMLRFASNDYCEPTHSNEINTNNTNKQTKMNERTNEQTKRDYNLNKNIWKTKLTVVHLCDFLSYKQIRGPCFYFLCLAHV